WTWAVDYALKYVSSLGVTGSASVGSAAAPPEWPARIGELAAGLHSALRVEPGERRADSSGDPDPRLQDRERAEAVFERVFAAIVTESHSSSDEDRGFAQRMLNRRAALAAALRAILPESASPLVFPHGDFHVGQLLRTAG